MSDEAAFLEALKANPADDTVRLVYADWLDEHAEPMKAEYLRLVATLAQATEDYTRDQPHVSRLFTLADTLPQQWRAEAGSRFKLVFYAPLDMANKVRIIKAVRALTNSLAEAAAIIELAPKPLFECVPFEQALLGRDPIREAGGAICVHPCECDDLPVGIRYNLMGCIWHSLHLPLTTEEKAPLGASLQNLLSISAEQASKLVADQWTGVILAEQFELAAGLGRKRELEYSLGTFFATVYPHPGRGVQLYLRPTVVYPCSQ